MRLIDKEIFLKEATLVKIEVFNDGDSWSMQWPKGNFVFRGKVEEFGKFLMKLKASDDKEDPRSHRSLKYLEIAKEIQYGHDRYIWVWQHILNKVRESNKMRRMVIEKGSATAKCPICGKKYLVATGYCVSCKKKVAEPKKEEEIDSNFDSVFEKAPQMRIDKAAIEAKKEAMRSLKVLITVLGKNSLLKPQVKSVTTMLNKLKDLSIQ